MCMVNCNYIVMMFTEFLAVISPSGIPMAGQSFSLTCSLTGGASLQPTLSYQWTREGGSLMTSTATLNFDTLYLSDAGQYSCQVILTSSQLEGEHTVAAHYTIEFMSKWLLYSKACWFNFTFVNSKIVLYTCM